MSNFALVKLILLDIDIRMDILEKPILQWYMLINVYHHKKIILALPKE
jgi:hypothetical protein